MTLPTRTLNEFSLAQILNPNEDKHQVQRLIKRLKSEIYPQIDRFIGKTTWGRGEMLKVTTLSYR